MNFETLFNQAVEDTTQRSLGHFSPELVLCGTILVMLFMRLFGADRRVPTYWVALLGAIVSFGTAWWQFNALSTNGAAAETFFTGLLVFDQFTVFFRLFLLLFLILVVVLTVFSGIPDLEDGPDFYSLLFGATVGMMLMASANHLLILFLGVEMSSVPSFVLVGFLKGRRLSSEAALKFVVYGAGAAGVMLYGLSLLAGLLGTASMPVLAERLNMLISEGAGMSDPVVRTVMLAIMMVLVGLAFKLSLVPFHFWIPDSFQGASAEVAGFLSVASKAAAFALLVRFCLAFVADEAAAMNHLYLQLGIGLGVIAAVTATYGNLVAYAQTNVKRLLAYSTVAHAGYMLMAVAAMIVVLNAPADGPFTRTQIEYQAARSLEGLLFYLAVYLFMNLAAFAIVALIRNEIFSEEIEDYNGLVYQTPALCVCMLLAMFSLIGLPPLGGFVAKFFVFASLFEAGKVAPAMWGILGLGAANTVFSLFYYLRVLKAMFLADRPEGARPARIPFRSMPAAFVLIISVPILLLGFAPGLVDGLSRTANNVASMLIGY